ncbi:MAG: class I SAM-dependent methyltransferase [Gemmatimonadota bacterium]
MIDEFWSQPDVVQQFASREPDHRLMAILADTPHGAPLKVLDLGCAGGRNTVLAAEHGLDVWAVDASPPMVERTRERLVPLIGAEKATARVEVGRMDDLSVFDDGFFDLIVALGIYHNARSRDEWEAAIAESARVLRPRGRLLVNHFTPEVDLTGEGVAAVPDRRDEYDGFPGGRVVLMDAKALDRAMAGHGLRPLTSSETIRVEAPPGRRVSVNAFYEREVGSLPAASSSERERGSIRTPSSSR